MNNLQPEHHPTSVKLYLVVGVALVILTSLTVYLSTLHLPKGTAIILAGSIAAVKCSLIAAIFMHLRSESKSIYFFIFMALFFLLVLVLTLIPDIGLHN